MFVRWLKLIWRLNIKWNTDLAIVIFYLVSQCDTHLTHLSAPLLKIKILNMVIPILMHFCSLTSNWSMQAAQTKCDVIKTSNNFMQYIAIILSQILTLSNQTSGYKSKYITCLAGKYHDLSNK